MIHPLGRKTPPDWEHVDKYPLRSLTPTAPVTVETVLSLPRYRTFYDQGQDGACVGFSSSWMLSIQRRRKFDARWLYHQAQLVDGDPSTPPAEGTLVRAGFDVLRDQGPMDWVKSTDVGPVAAQGLTANRWATTVDEVRAAFALGVPVVFGINWYTAFDKPIRFNGEWWIEPHDDFLGTIRGGHAICAFGCSDKRGAVKLVNSWGAKAYPLVWMRYSVIERLLSEDGECAVPVDR